MPADQNNGTNPATRTKSSTWHDYSIDRFETAQRYEDAEQREPIEGEKRTECLAFKRWLGSRASYSPTHTQLRELDGQTR